MKKALIIALAWVAVNGCSEADRAVPEAGTAEVCFSLRGVSADILPSGEACALWGTDPAGTVTRATPESLAPGTTVRIVAYVRRDGGAAADIEQDAYAGEATYCVGEDLSLEPCTVDEAGASTGTAGAAVLRLRAGTYDFYALTPALPLAERKRASVVHGTDYACSLTPPCSITPPASGAQTVVLAMLGRRCSRLTFSITRKAENIAKAVIESVKLSRIGHAPAEANLCEALPLGANDGSYPFPDGTFTPGAEPYQSSGADEVLPKSSAVFDLAMKVTFNDAAEASELEAEIPAMAFDACKRYNFDVSLQGKFIVLTLQVTPWNEDAVWDAPGIGEPSYAGVVVGKWEISDWTTDIGGAFVPRIAPASWEPNGDWETDLGDYLSAAARINGWNDDPAWSTDFGGA